MVSGLDTWAAGFIALLIAIIYVVVILKIMGNSSVSLITMLGQRSPALGAIFGIILAFNFVLIAIVYLYDFQTFMNMTSFPKTPPVIIDLLLISLSVYAVLLGWEVLARIAGFLLLPVIFLVLWGVVPSLFTIDFLPELIPLGSWTDVLKGAFFHTAVYGELLVLVMLLPLTKKPSGTAKYIIVPMVFSALLIAALALALFGDYSAVNTAPDVTYKLFSLFRLLGRYEALFIVLWVCTFFVKITIFYFAAIQGLGDALKLKSPKATALPLAAVITFLGITSFSNYIEYLSFLLNYYPFFALAIELTLLPFLLIALPREQALKTG